MVSGLLYVVSVEMIVLHSWLLCTVVRMVVAAGLEAPSRPWENPPPRLPLLP